MQAYLITFLTVGNGVSRTVIEMMTKCTIPTALSIGKQAEQVLSCKINLQQCTVEVGTRHHTICHLQATMANWQSFNRASTIEARHLATIVPKDKPLFAREVAMSMAIIGLHLDEHLSGYMIHPAALDSCLHGGLALVPQDSLEHARKTQVPRGLGVYMILNPLITMADAYVIIQVCKSPSTMLLSNSHHVQQDHGMLHCGFNIVDLHIQEMQRNHVQRKDVETFIPRNDQLSYLISWQYSEREERGTRTAKGLVEERMHIWSNKDTEFFIGKLPSASKSVIASSLMDVGTIQKLLRGSSSTLSLSLLTTAYLGHDDIAPTKHINLAHRWSDIDFERNAAALATIKVAASEHPQHTWCAVISSPISKVLTATHKGVDAFGTMIHGGTIETPRILMAKQEMNKSTTYANQDSRLSLGETVISGGLGGKPHVSRATLAHAIRLGVHIQM